VWREEPPESHNAYRVECTVCGRFSKWGTEAELQSLKAVGAQVTLVPYDAPENSPTLDEFFE
jgi:hypothetical protein